jgi:hypothetical protein
MRGVLLVRGLGANPYSIGIATDTGIEVFFSNNTVSFTPYIVFGLIASLDYETNLLDIKTAFLYVNLDEEICPSRRVF